MKFGRTLPSSQVPEWSGFYIKYKQLKKLVKQAYLDATAENTASEADLALFFFTLDRSLETVDQFFNKHKADVIRRISILQRRYDTTYDRPEALGSSDIEDLANALLELRAELRNLTWYADINRQGFVKILKKLDKKVPNKGVAKTYLDSKVLAKPFASPLELQTSIKNINSQLAKLDDMNEQRRLLESDDNKSVHSLSMLQRVSSGAYNGFPTDVSDQIEYSIQNDEVSVIDQLISNQGDMSEESEYQQKTYVRLLQRAITFKARTCIDYFLSRITGDLSEKDDDINGRNCIHRLVISISRQKANAGSGHKTTLTPGHANGNGITKSSLEPPFFIRPSGSPLSRTPISDRVNLEELDETSGLLGPDDESVKLLVFLLDSLRAHQHSALSARDSFSRLPLHYAAQFGFVIICKTVIKYMQDWNQFDIPEGIDSEEWQDQNGLAPLHLAVIGGHPKTTRAILLSETWSRTNESVIAAKRKTVSESSAALRLATMKNEAAIVKLLIDAGVDLDFQDDQGETALHIAARFNYMRCAKMLVEGSESQKADIEIAESTYGWTPVFVAAASGNLEVANILMSAGADLEKIDSSGWRAEEHAALRGHIELAKLLTEKRSSHGLDTSKRPALRPGTDPETEISVPLYGNSALAVSSRSLSESNPQLVRTFGHRYIGKGKTMVLVTLGSVDDRKVSPVVNIDQIPLADWHSTQLDTALSLVVSAKNAKGEGITIDLPIESSAATEPIAFETEDFSSVKLTFDLVPTYSGSKSKIVGRGAALLASIKPDVGKSRMNLNSSITIPILSVGSMEVVGSVSFDFLVITPFDHPNMAIARNQTYWKKVGTEDHPTTVIGHRGLGKNLPSAKSLQLGENTLQSFIAAANLGATYIEFDVQMTKDHVPVIYHDFLVGETGIDAPVHTLTLDQFMSMSDELTPRHSRSTSPDVRWDDDFRPVISSKSNPPLNGMNAVDGSNSESSNIKHKSTPVRRRGRPRSKSLIPSDHRENAIIERSERMKHTRDFKLKGGFKGNSRGTSIQGPFATLAELFKKLDPRINFNIELKYPMLQESQDEDMDTFAIEMNFWVDTVLKVVYDNQSPDRTRDIVFSSFNPDICLMVSLKQPSIPVLFLTESGTMKMHDVRASSLQEAIRFATRWNLLGIVSSAEPFVLCPKLINIVKSSGLVCITYGTLNNEKYNAIKQAEHGIDAVIVDNVLAIRNELVNVKAKKANLAKALNPEIAKSVEIIQAHLNRVVSTDRLAIRETK